MKQTPGSVYFKNLKELLVLVIANNKKNHLLRLSVKPSKNHWISLNIGKEPMVFRAFILTCSEFLSIMVVYQHWVFWFFENCPETW
jgi:hypothetical protein